MNRMNGIEKTMVWNEDAIRGYGVGEGNRAFHLYAIVDVLEYLIGTHAWKTAMGCSQDTIHVLLLSRTCCNGSTCLH